MSQRAAERVERAVDTLLMPRHYELLLFLQKKAEKRKEGDPFVFPVADCRKVMRIMAAEEHSDVISSVEEAGQVLKKALSRLG